MVPSTPNISRLSQMTDVTRTSLMNYLLLKKRATGTRQMVKPENRCRGYSISDNVRDRVRGDEVGEWNPAKLVNCVGGVGKQMSGWSMGYKSIKLNKTLILFNYILIILKNVLSLWRIHVII
jgi:hypothetical protein